jgi:hypothetical protein
MAKLLLVGVEQLTGEQQKKVLKKVSFLNPALFFNRDNNFVLHGHEVL